MFRLVVLMVLRLALFALVVHLVYLACGAPVPYKYQPKTDHPDVFVGAWRMNWGGVNADGQAVFHKQGGYTCAWYGLSYIGFWSFKDDVLSVTEAVTPRDGDMPTWITWQAVVERGKRAGYMRCNGTPFMLRPATTKPEREK